MFEIAFEPDTEWKDGRSDGWYRSQIEHAFDAIDSLFEGAGFTFGTRPLEQVVLITDAGALKEIVSRAFGIQPGLVPDTFAGSPDGSTLYMAVPDIAEPMLRRLYPEIPWDGDHEYFECIKHEIFHMFHECAAIELSGSADGMGPVWFFESLAVAGSGQFHVLKHEPPLSPERKRAIIERSRMGPVSYVEFGRIGYTLLRRCSMRELIESAGRPAACMEWMTDDRSQDAGDK